MTDLLLVDSHDSLLLIYVGINPYTTNMDLIVGEGMNITMKNCSVKFERYNADH